MKKSLGQHWLNDEAALNAMCEAAGVDSQDTVLEIGPGMGSLTKPLTKRAKQVIAIEKDEELAELLQKSKIAGNLQIISGDVLALNLTELPIGYKVVANIPYYLTSNLLRFLCESSNPFTRAALLVQKEVAERVVSFPGHMSVLSVSVQFYCKPSLGLIVPSALFTPPPKVDSQILILEYRGPMFDVDTEKFFRIVKAGFSEKRKKLKSSISGGMALGKSQAEYCLTQAGIDPNSRAQELPLQAWYDLYIVLGKEGIINT